jgi:hypothetical protein
MRHTLLEKLIKYIVLEQIQQQRPPEHGKMVRISVSNAQASKLSGVLSSLGINPDTVIKSEEGALEEDALSASPDDREGPELTYGKKVTFDPNKKEPKPRSTKMSVEISPASIEAAKQFFAVGQIGASWYHDAHNSINAGFASEEDRVLFALLLAATSVQNEIYTNFIEAGVIFNSIKKDVRENGALLRKMINDPTVNVGAKNLLDHPEYSQLNIFKDPKSVKITNIGSKFGNIKRFMKLYLNGQLTKDMVRNMIAASVRPSDVSFERRSPLIQRLKIANYALTLVDPDFASTKENPFNVVVDTWMFRIFYPESTGKGTGAKGKAMIGKLFGSEVAYANVANAVSNLAAEAGVSPHVMQAALWTGIKKTWEGESADASNYISAIKQMVARYAEFWKDMEVDTSNLGAVVSKLDPISAGAYLKDRRADVIRGVVARGTEKRRADRAAAGIPEPVAKTRNPKKSPVPSTKK